MGIGIRGRGKWVGRMRMTIDDAEEMGRKRRGMRGMKGRNRWWRCDGENSQTGESRLYS